MTDSSFIPDDWTPSERPRDDIKLLLYIEQYSWERKRIMYGEAGRAAPKEVEFHEYTLEKLRQLVEGLDTGKFKLVAVKK